MTEMIVVGLFTIAGSILGAITALLGVSSSRSLVTKKYEDISDGVQQVHNFSNTFDGTSNDR